MCVCLSTTHISGTALPTFMSDRCVLAAPTDGRYQCSLRGPPDDLEQDVYGPARLCCVWPQNLEPTTHDSSITRTNADFVQAPAQDPLVCYSTRLVLAAVVGVVYSRLAPLWLYSEFGADYTSVPTRLNSMVRNRRREKGDALTRGQHRRQGKDCCLRVPCYRGHAWHAQHLES